jgi:GNAT superfamily N-acetyltransferase
VPAVVRQAERSDRPALDQFLAEAYGSKAPYKLGERWSWQFARNPFWHASDGRVPVWIAVDDGRIVGQIAVQVGRLQVERRTLDAGWIVDVMILPSHRGEGLGHRLHDGVASGMDVLVTLTMAPATRRIAERGGSIEVGDVDQFTRWIRLDADTVRRYLLVRTVNHRRARVLVNLACALQAHRALPAFVNPLLRLRDAVKRVPQSASTVEITEVAAFGPDGDRLWAATSSDYPVAFVRDTMYLNWRFVDCPGLRYRKFVAKRDGATVGYVVLRLSEPVELSQGFIVDLYAARHDKATLTALVRHSLAFFGDAVATVECATSVPEHRAVYRKHGFVRTRTEHPTVVCRDPTLRARLEELADDWLLSKGDHDWDQIHLA